MNPIKNATGKSDVKGSLARNIAQLATLLAAVLALGIVAAIAARPQLVDAYANARDGTEIQARPGGEAAAEVYVWAAALTVGESSDASATYLGYMPDAVPEPGDQGSLGNLQGDTFTYQGVEYTVLALFQQQMGDGSRQLILRMDRPLPEYLNLHTRDGAFPISDATVMDDGPTVYEWPLDEALTWRKGQTTYVVLLGPHGGHIQTGGVTVTTPPDSPGGNH